MINVVSALTARTQLGQIIKRATQKNERFLAGRRGEPNVVTMSIDDYVKTFAPAPKELAAMQEAAKKTGAGKLNPGQINWLVAKVRRDKETTSANPRTK
jgi:hypothetical protein